MAGLTLTLPRLLAGILMGASAAAGAQALDLSWSGFGTLGYARTDTGYRYQRFIDRDGSFQRDSLLAGQADLRLTPQWSATVQARLAACDNRDGGVCARAAWAFVAWRPDDDWLLRLGRARAPLYLYSESLDVGVSHDMARLPHEVYSATPSNDFDGVFATRNFTLGSGEYSVEAYAGSGRPTARIWLSDGVPGGAPAGPWFQTVRGDIRGIVLTRRDDTLTWRASFLHGSARRPDGGTFVVRYPYVSVAPGVGYWKVDAAMPGPNLETVSRIREDVLTVGAEWQLGAGWRVAGEGVRVMQRDTELGSDSHAGYLALFKRIGEFTPYLSLARQRSGRTVLGWQQRLATTQLPAALPGAALINAAERAASQGLYAFDQRSIAVGASYALSPTAKLKAEWMHTRVGQVSAHFDVPPGGAGSAGLKAHTVSANLSLAF